LGSTPPIAYLSLFLDEKKKTTELFRNRQRERERSEERRELCLFVWQMKEAGVLMLPGKHNKNYSSSSSS
jgi:hypothetical protein